MKFRDANGLEHDTTTWTRDQIAGKYPHIIQPPHPYYDIKNKGGLSAFPPGMPPAFYDPFLEFFAEREQTALAQGRLHARKRRDRLAYDWSCHAAGWRKALECCQMRQARALEQQIDRYYGAQLEELQQGGLF